MGSVYSTTLKGGAGVSEFKGNSDHTGSLRLISLIDIIKTYLLNSRAKNAIHWYNAGLLCTQPLVDIHD